MTLDKMIRDAKSYDPALVTEADAVRAIVAWMKEDAPYWKIGVKAVWQWRSRGVPPSRRRQWEAMHG